MYFNKKNLMSEKNGNKKVTIIVNAQKYLQINNYLIETNAFNYSFYFQTINQISIGQVNFDTSNSNIKFEMNHNKNSEIHFDKTFESLKRKCVDINVSDNPDLSIYFSGNADNFIASKITYNSIYEDFIIPTTSIVKKSNENQVDVSQPSKKKEQTTIIVVAVVLPILIIISIIIVMIIIYKKKNNNNTEDINTVSV